jgi:soluble lytic murein transglycosylase-like protein
VDIFAKFFRVSIAACLIGIPAYSHADIYGYVDEQGIAHLATEKIDARYQLFMRKDEGFDSTQLTPSEPAESKSQPFHLLSQHPNLKKYEGLLSQAAQEFDLDPALLKAIMAAESGFNPQAVSEKGAIGLMQVIPATAERYGVAGDRQRTIQQKLTDPKINIRLAARYLRDLYKMFPGKQQLVLASYNAGEGAVYKYRHQIPPYPETRNYVQLVMQLYESFKPPAAAELPAVAARRVHMFIPGRRNMPATSVE